MRRIMAVFASVALVAVLAGSATAAPSSRFNGDFDVLLDGSVIGHIRAQLSSTDFSGPAGSYAFNAPDGSHGVAQVGEDLVHRLAEPGFDHVWFKGLEIGVLDRAAACPATTSSSGTSSTCSIRPPPTTWEFGVSTSRASRRPGAASCWATSTTVGSTWARARSRYWFAGSGSRRPGRRGSLYSPHRSSAVHSLWPMEPSSSSAARRTRSATASS